jgi:DNA-binding PadR family transcriptional regulator
MHPAILIVLSGSGRHGYEIARLLQTMPTSRGQAPDMTGIYRCLRHMQRQGYVVSKWERSDNGPSRRVFSVTSAGRACLRRWLATLRAYGTAIAQLLMQGRRAVALADAAPRRAAARHADRGRS